MIDGIQQDNIKNSQSATARNISASQAATRYIAVPSEHLHLIQMMKRAVNWCTYTCETVNRTDNQDLNAYNYQNAIINNRQNAKQKNLLSQDQE
jgi:hypothetical protein